ncbi:hypothetical protein QR97_35505 [Streptomyces sp. PBH53]|nr:hypothetical protein QR97_35505 [Streptomyces sp. PBH53]
MPPGSTGVPRRAGFPDREAVRICHAFADQALASGAPDSAGTALPPAAPDPLPTAARTRLGRLRARTGRARSH